MNILYVAHERNLGGASRSLVTLAEEMLARGHQVTVVVPFRSGQVFRALKERGIEVRKIFFGWRMMPRAWNPLLKLMFRALYASEGIAVCRIAALARKRGVELIHSNSSVIDAGARAALRCGVPHVWHFREFGEPDYGLEYLEGKEKGCQRACAVPGRIVFISRCLREYYGSEIGDGSCRILYNGISRRFLYEKYKKLPDGRKERTADGTEAGTACKEGAACKEGPACKAGTACEGGERTVVFLIAGNLHPGKRQELAIAACERLLAHGFCNFRLVVAGAASALKESKEFEKELKERAERTLCGHVTFTGHVSDMAALRKTTDVELVCSAMEAFGRVTVEAMLSSNPVIGADSGATPELIRNGENGLLFPGGDVEKLENSMRYFIEHPQEIRRMGAQAYRFAEERFLSERNTEETERLYRELLGEDRREDA